MLRVVEGSSKGLITIHSPVLGRLDLDEHQIIEFSDPIAGFPQCRRYILLPYVLSGREDAAMCWLQAVDAPFHTFLVTDPWSAIPEYQPEIADAEVERLDAPALTDTVILGILTVARRSGELTINLQAPLVVNTRARRGKQVLVLNNETYSARHRVCELP